MDNFAWEASCCRPLTKGLVSVERARETVSAGEEAM